MGSSADGKLSAAPCLPPTPIVAQLALLTKLVLPPTLFPNSVGADTDYWPTTETGVSLEGTTARTIGVALSVSHTRSVLGDSCWAEIKWLRWYWAGILLVTLALVSTHISLFRTDGVRTSQQCVCIYTAVYSQTLTAISIFKYVNIVCIIQVHTRSCDFTAHMCTGMILSN